MYVQHNCLINLICIVFMALFWLQDQRLGTSISRRLDECEGQAGCQAGIPISYTIDFVAAREPRAEILAPSCRRNHSILC